MNAIYRAGVHASRVLGVNAWFRNHICHKFLVSLRSDC
jgi:hypothetical protein